jgi:hypothetical protein
MNVDEIPAHHVLEDVPFARLGNTFTRRQFFTFIRNEWGANMRKGNGGVVGDILSLGNCTFEEMMEIVPVIVPECRITIKDQAIWIQPPTRPKALKVLPVDNWTLFAFNRINGSEALFDIALALEEKGWPQKRARAFTRGLFLTLVNARACVPYTPPI